MDELFLYRPVESAVKSAGNFSRKGSGGKELLSEAICFAAQTWRARKEAAVEHMRRSEDPGEAAACYLRSGMWDIAGATGIEEEQHEVQFRVWW